MVTALHRRTLTLQGQLPKAEETISPMLWSRSPGKARVITSARDRYNQSQLEGYWANRC